MLANQLLTTHFPCANPDDKVSATLQIMDDFDTLHIAVVSTGVFMGVLSKDDLLDADENATIRSLEMAMLRTAVKSSEHFLSAIKLASENSLSMVPVINDSQEWLGAIVNTELIKAASQFTGAEVPGALIVLEMERKSYSFGEISRLVETNDAYITQCNTFFENETGLLIVTVKVNKLEVSDILATFQRYEYNVRYFIGEEQYENELRYNYDNLMSYLKV